MGRTGRGRSCRAASFQGDDGCVRCHRSAEALQRPMQARLRGGKRDPERGRGIGQRVAEVVVQDDERPMLRLEPVERSLDEVTVREVTTRVAARGLVDGQDLDLDWAPPASAGLVEAAVDQEAMEPGI